MTLSWEREPRPVWDEDKERIIGAAPQGALDVPHTPGGSLLGDWWLARDHDGTVVAYGWLDATWGGDAEILLAVDPSRQRSGAGTFVLRNLEREAAARGINYVYNTVAPTHPQRDDVQNWLAVRGYRGNVADDTMRKRVTLDDEARTMPPQRAAAASVPSDALPPGREESGGYVDIEEHRY